jgi:hypothetical protein
MWTVCASFLRFKQKISSYHLASRIYRHNVWDYAGKESTLTTWLLAQSKGSVHNSPTVIINNFSVDLLPDRNIYVQWNLPSQSGLSQDNKIWYCKIYRNGVVIKEAYNDKSSYVDSTATEPAQYDYKISAVNFYFRESDASQIISINKLK